MNQITIFTSRSGQIATTSSYSCISGYNKSKNMPKEYLTPPQNNLFRQLRMQQAAARAEKQEVFRTGDGNIGQNATYHGPGVEDVQPATQAEIAQAIQGK